MQQYKKSFAYFLYNYIHNLNVIFLIHITFFSGFSSQWTWPIVLQLCSIL